MIAYIPAPALCQGADEDLIIEMGAIIFPGFVERNPSANGLRLKLEGDYRDDSLLKTVADQFQALLGVLRAWRPLAGLRSDEVRPGIGTGSIRDDHGNQVIRVGSAMAYLTCGSEVEAYAREAKLASEHSTQRWASRKGIWNGGVGLRRPNEVCPVFSEELDWISCT